LRVEVVFDPGPDLFSQGPTSQVSSALVGLTAVFGMGTGVTPPLQGPRRQLYQRVRARANRTAAGSASGGRRSNECWRRQELRARTDAKVDALAGCWL